MKRLLAVLMTTAALLFQATPAASTPPTSLIVTKTADTNGTCLPGDCSLREAIAAANSDPDTNTITFAIPFADPSCSGGVCTITLSGSALDINTSMSIVNTDPVGAPIVVNGNGASRVFFVRGPITVAITGLTVTGGFISGDQGGGITSNATALTLTDMSIGCTIHCSGGNSANYGGGIENFGTINIINSTITGNSAYGVHGGGLYNHSGGGASITNSTISGNSAAQNGGGIHKDSGGVSITNSTISGNSSGGSGGAIYFLSGGSTPLTNVTISGNTAPGGGGIVNGGAGITLQNTIVAGNNPGPPVANADVTGVFGSLGHNLIGIGDGSSGFGATGDQVGTVASPIDAKLVALADNGGPTQTMALGPGSLAIDAGDDAVTGLPLNLTTDQRGPGYPRKSGSHVDVGAFEVQPPADTTPPVILPTVTGTVGSNGWYRSGVTVNWSVKDPESGIASSRGCGTTMLTVDTAGTRLTCSATNGAGLTAENSVTVKIDQHAPVLTGMPPTTCTIKPSEDKLVTAATISASDAMSGVASFNVTVTSSVKSGDDEGDHDKNESDIVITGTGVGPRVVKIRTQGSEDGKRAVYTLTATAADKAGNSLTSVSKCTVAKHDDNQHDN